MRAIEAEIDAAHRRPQRAARACRACRPSSATTRRRSTLPSLVALYRLAHFCIVSSLHDGMNLVAKEFVAARDDERRRAGAERAGRRRAGAATTRCIINPYDVDGFAAALVAGDRHAAAPSRRARMRAMRRVVAGRNVFGWASDILEGLESLWTKPLLYAVRGWEETSV